MICGETASANLPARDHLIALRWLREQILGQAAIDPRQGVRARRTLLSLKHDCEHLAQAFARGSFAKDPAQVNVIHLHPGSTGMAQAPGKLDAAISAALDMLNMFERAIIENHDRLSVEACRLNCLATLDRLLQRVQPGHSGGF